MLWTALNKIKEEMNIEEKRSELKQEKTLFQIIGDDGVNNRKECRT